MSTLYMCRCDGPGVDGRCHTTTAAFITEERLFQHLHDVGWTNDGLRDLCLDCSRRDS